MKLYRVLFSIVLIAALLAGCGRSAGQKTDIAATTLPVYEFTGRLCDGSGLRVGRLISEPVSCLHDYTLQVRQLRLAADADLIVISGVGLEDFLDGVLPADTQTVDASVGVPLLPGEEEFDPHIWLCPENAKRMASNICAGLCEQYPNHAALFTANLEGLLADLDALQSYGDALLADLQSRDLVTFHDGFSYFSQAFDLDILAAVEEESGSEVSAGQMRELIELVQAHAVPAIFTETSGSTAAATVLSAETGVPISTLDMAISGESYFDAMYRNMDTIREVLG